MLALKAFCCLLRCDDGFEILAIHAFDVVTHGLATRPVATLLFGDAEAELVHTAEVGRNAHLEDANSFPGGLVVDFVVVVIVLDFFESLLLVEQDFVHDRAIQV